MISVPIEAIPIGRRDASTQPIELRDGTIENTSTTNEACIDRGHPGLVAHREGAIECEVRMDD